MTPPVVVAIRHGLAEAADGQRALQMRAYMKSEMPYRGVPAPAQRRVTKAAARDHPIACYEEWRTVVEELWRGAEYREERYTAIEVAADRRFASRLDSLDLFDEMIVTGAWWDYVDGIAIHRIGGLLGLHPQAMKPVVRRWSVDDDMWRRRSAILAQNAFKSNTDVNLLYACIEPNLADPEFFIRKAIGWALRQYAWTDPAEIARYVKEYDARLSGLSKREATKNLAVTSTPRRTPRAGERCARRP